MDMQTAEHRAREIQKMVRDHVDRDDNNIPVTGMGDILLFIGLRYTYRALKNGFIAKEEARLEKKKLLLCYLEAECEHERYLSAARHRNRIGSELVKLERCGCKYCQTMIRLFDNRELFSRVEAEEQEQV